MSRSNAQVDIALACYNGMPYLKELISSLEQQTYKEWRVIARDDNSSDQTPSMLGKMSSENKNFCFIEGERNIGVVKNFEYTLQGTSADYIMLADQDDYWRPEKIELSLTAIKKMEQNTSKSMPCLFFTDLAVANEKLEIVHSSFWKYAKMDVARTQELNKILVRNVVPGCSMIVNRALLTKALPFADNVVMHDWWLLLVAISFGKVNYSATTTIKYRQHQSNIDGAKRKSTFKDLLDFTFSHKKTKDATKLTKKQAESMLKRYAGTLDSKSIDILQAYCNSRNESTIRNRYRCYQQGISSRGIISNIGLYLTL